MTHDLIALLSEARPHVKATVDRTNTRLVYTASVELLARIDSALGDLARPATELDGAAGPDMDEDGPIVWP